MTMTTWALRQEEFAELVRATTEAAAAAAVAAHSSQVTELLRGQQVNDVLFSGLVTLDSTGQGSLSFAVAFATVMAYNLDAATVTIVQGPGQGQAPNISPGNVYAGVHPILTHTGRTFPITSGVFAIYGAGGAQIDVAVFAALQPSSPT